MNIIPDEDKLIGKTIVAAEIGGYGIRLKFSDGSILDYSSSSDGDSCWEIIDGANQVDKSEDGQNREKNSPFLTQLFCKHTFINDHVTVVTSFWPYSEAHYLVKRCTKCGKIIWPKKKKRSENA